MSTQAELVQATFDGLKKVMDSRAPLTTREAVIAEVEALLARVNPDFKGSLSLEQKKYAGASPYGGDEDRLSLVIYFK
jgi:hypothetical protein